MIDPKLIDMENWNEHYIKKSTSSKLTYYIIRRYSVNVGLFSNFTLFAGHIRYALSNGWIPVVDMQNYRNNYLPLKKLGEENAWEYYFEQPFRIGLEEAYSGDNIILSTGHFVPSPQFNRMDIYELHNKTLMEWKMLVKLGLLKVKPERMEEILAIKKELFSPNDRVLGVFLRGTDYVAKKPKNHPIPPPPEYATNTVLSRMKEWNCNKIFLATEDRSLVEIFKNVFGDACVTINREYVDYDPQKDVLWLPRLSIEREDDNFLQGKEYLTEVMLFSMCNSLVFSGCNGALGALILASDNVENSYFFNLGRYGIYDKL